MYAWVNQTLVPNLYTSGWYNGQGLQDWREALQVDDHVTVRLGVARLRQLRIKNGTLHCRAEYWVLSRVGSLRSSMSLMAKLAMDAPDNDFQWSTGV